MTALVLLSTLLMLASVGPEITELDSTRFRVSIVFDDQSPMGHAKAQIGIVKAAKKHCAGKGSKATSEGSLELNNAQSIRTGKKAVELIEIYSCVPKQS
jgi:hypothetical protein